MSIWVFDKKSELKSIAMLIAANIIPVFSQLIILKLVSTELSIDRFGVYAFLMTFNVLITQLFSNGIISMSARFYDSGNNFSEAFFLRNYLSIYLKNVAIIILLWIIFSIYLYSLFGTLGFYGLAIIVTTCLFEVLGQSYISICNKIERRKEIFTYTSLLNFIKILGVITLVFVNYLTINLILLSYLFSVVLSLLIILIINRKKILSIFKNYDLSYFITFSTDQATIDYVKPFYISGIFSFCYFVADKWFIQFFTDEYLLGLYSVYFQIGYSPFTYLGLVLTMYLSPKFYNKHDSNTKLTFSLKRSFLFFSPFLISIVMISLVFANKIIVLLSDSKYLELSHFFVVLVASGCFYVYSQILNLYLLAEKRIKLYSKIQIAVSLFSLFSVFIFINFLPFKYFPLSFLLTNILLVVLLLIVICRK